MVYNGAFGVIVTLVIASEGSKSPTSEVCSTSFVYCGLDIMDMAITRSLISYETGEDLQSYGSVLRK